MNSYVSGTEAPKRDKRQRLKMDPFVPTVSDTVSVILFFDRVHHRGCWVVLTTLAGKSYLSWTKYR